MSRSTRPWGWAWRQPRWPPDTSTCRRKATPWTWMCLRTRWISCTSWLASRTFGTSSAAMPPRMPRRIEVSDTLFDRIWNAHEVARLPGEISLLHVDRHLMHELTVGDAMQRLTSGTEERRVGKEGVRR